MKKAKLKKKILAVSIAGLMSATAVSGAITAIASSNITAFATGFDSNVTFSATDSVITATDNDDSATATYTLTANTAENLVYTGSTISLLKSDIKWMSSDGSVATGSELVTPTIKIYAKDDTTKADLSTTGVINAGVYTVEATAGTATASLDVTVAPKVLEASDIDISNLDEVHANVRMTASDLGIEIAKYLKLNKNLKPNGAFNQFSVDVYKNGVKAQSKEKLVDGQEYTFKIVKYVELEDSSEVSAPNLVLPKNELTSENFKVTATKYDIANLYDLKYIMDVPVDLTSDPTENAVKSWIYEDWIKDNIDVLIDTSSHKITLKAKDSSEILTGAKEYDNAYSTYDVNAPTIATKIALSEVVDRKVEGEDEKVFVFTATETAPKEATGTKTYIWSINKNGNWEVVTSTDSEDSIYQDKNKLYIKLDEIEFEAFEIKVRARTTDSVLIQAISPWSNLISFNAPKAPAPPAQDGAGSSVINTADLSGDINKISDKFVANTKLDGKILLSASDFGKNKINSTLGTFAESTQTTEQQNSFATFCARMFGKSPNDTDETDELTFPQMLLSAFYYNVNRSLK